MANDHPKSARPHQSDGNDNQQSSLPRPPEISNGEGRSETKHLLTRMMRAIGRRLATGIVPLTRFYADHRVELLNQLRHQLGRSDRNYEILLRDNGSLEEVTCNVTGWTARLPACCVVCGESEGVQESIEEYHLADMNEPLRWPIYGLFAGAVLGFCFGWFWSGATLGIFSGAVAAWLFRVETRLLLRVFRCSTHATESTIPVVYLHEGSMIIRVGDRSVKSRFREEFDRGYLQRQNQREALGISDPSAATEKPADIVITSMALVDDVEGSSEIIHATPLPLSRDEADSRSPHADDWVAEKAASDKWGTSQGDAAARRRKNEERDRERQLKLKEQEKQIRDQVKATEYHRFEAPDGDLDPARPAESETTKSKKSETTDQDSADHQIETYSLRDDTSRPTHSSDSQRSSKSPSGALSPPPLTALGRERFGDIFGDSDEFQPETVAEVMTFHTLEEDLAALHFEESQDYRTAQWLFDNEESFRWLVEHQNDVAQRERRIRVVDELFQKYPTFDICCYWAARARCSPEESAEFRDFHAAYKILSLGLMRCHKRAQLYEFLSWLALESDLFDHPGPVFVGATIKAFLAAVAVDEEPSRQVALQLAEIVPECLKSDSTDIQQLNMLAAQLKSVDTKLTVEATVKIIQRLRQIPPGERLSLQQPLADFTASFLRKPGGSLFAPKSPLVLLKCPCCAQRHVLLGREENLETIRCRQCSKQARRTEWTAWPRKTNSSKQPGNQAHSPRPESAPRPIPSSNWGYYECDVPDGDGACSDNECPCPDTIIPRGTGYLYISKENVELRRQYPSPGAARRAMHERISELQAETGGLAGGTIRLGPILVCELGAKRRKLDLATAAADCRYWWSTGQVPLRPTPLASDAARLGVDEPAENLQAQSDLPTIEADPAHQPALEDKATATAAPSPSGSRRPLETGQRLIDEIAADQNLAPIDNLLGGTRAAVFLRTLLRWVAIGLGIGVILEMTIWYWNGGRTSFGVTQFPVAIGKTLDFAIWYWFGVRPSFADARIPFGVGAIVTLSFGLVGIFRGLQLVSYRRRVSEILCYLFSDHYATAREALYSLQRLGISRVVPLLREELNGDHALAASCALAACGDETQAQHLLSVLSTSTMYDKGRAAGYLGLLRDPRAIESLNSLLAQRDDRATVHIASAVAAPPATISDRDFRLAILDMGLSESDDAAIGAINALVELGMADELNVPDLDTFKREARQRRKKIRDAVVEQWDRIHHTSGPGGCPQCGRREWRHMGSYRICQYCGRSS